MNILDAAGYSLGVLLLAKCLIRRRLGYRPPGWDFFDTSTPERARTTELLTQGLAWLTVFLLLYTFISAANARAAYDWEKEKFRYRDCIAWLPHSYDGPATWRAFPITWPGRAFFGRCEIGSGLSASRIALRWKRKRIRLGAGHFRFGFAGFFGSCR